MAQKVRVFKLAREFGMDNETMVHKIQEMGIEVRNYMSSLEVDAALKIKRNLDRERAENTIEEQIRPTVVRRRTRDGAPAKPKRVRPPKVDEVDTVKEVTSIAPATRKVKPVTEEAPPQVAPPPVEAPPEEVLATPEEPPVFQAETVTAELVEPEPIEQPPASLAPGGPIVEEKRRPKVEVATGPAIRRPSAEAPVIRRRITQTGRPSRTPTRTQGQGRPSSGGRESIPDLSTLSNFPPTPKDGQTAGKRGRSAPQRRREVQSRDMVPQGRFTGTGPGGGGKYGVTAPGRKRRMAPGKKGKKTEITTPKASKRVIRIEEQVSLQELAKRMGVKATELLMHLMGMGVGTININSTLDADTAKIVASDFGYEVENVAIVEDELLSSTRSEEDDSEDREPRPPVVTMMGHVDHGKTSLLDALRKSSVVSSEAGGITQHLGAYRVKTSSGVVAFLDTPGHEAFTAMRARGATATDIVILVVAADDGVMPQTIEAINHSRAAAVPIIVAINKCDLPGADPSRARNGLMEHNLIPEDLGGDIIMTEVSAKTGEGLEKLMEMIALQAEVMELNANPKRPAKGIVLEAYLDRGRGPVANILVQDGTLRVGETIVAGASYGKIRALTDERGRPVKEAGPSTPVEVLGLDSVPQAGDPFDAAPDLKVAEKVAKTRSEKSKASQGLAAKPSLDNLFEQMQAAEKQMELNIIIKGDVQGSVEALKESLEKLTTEKVKLTVVHSSVGGITESDVLLASTAGAIIVGFNVRPAGKARRMAEEQGVEFRLFSIIYEVIDSIEQAMVGLLAPEVREEILGQVEVRDTFTIPKIGTVAGSYVTEGKVVRNSRARLIRDSVQIWEGKLGSLRRFKDDVKEVTSGFECGISLLGYNDVKVGDVIEIYTKKEVAATLS